MYFVLVLTVGAYVCGGLVVILHICGRLSLPCNNNEGRVDSDDQPMSSSGGVTSP